MRCETPTAIQSKVQAARKLRDETATKETLVSTNYHAANGQTTTLAAGDLVAVARELGPLVSDCAAESDRLRTLSPRVVDALWTSGLMTALNPIDGDGVEPSLGEMVDVWIEMSCQDGSYGWTSIANMPSSFCAATYLPDEGFAEIFTSNGNHVTMGGQFFPNGQGVAVDGGYRISGAWSFGSGTGHSQYIAAGFLPTDNGEMRWLTTEMPMMMVAFIPREEVTFTDGWHVQGLRGTGSFDYTVTDVFVPEYRTCELFTHAAHRGNYPAARMGMMSVTAAGHAAWALGVARSMLDDIEELAQTKIRMGDLTSLAHRPSFQKNLVHHQAAWRSARLLVLDTFHTVESAIAEGEDLTPRMRADIRVATIYATDISRAVAEWAHLAAGTAAIRDGSRLERAFRDIYTGTQHAFVGERVATDAAQVTLGLIEDHPAL